MKETVKDMNIDMEAVKNTHTEGILDMENLGKWTRTAGTSLTNNVSEME